MRKRIFYHGSQRKGLEVLHPQLDKRLGIRGVFLSNEPFGPMVFSLIKDRSKAHVEYKTQGGRFMDGKIIAPFELNDTGWLYTLELDPEKLNCISHGEFYSNSAAKISSCKLVTKEEVLEMQWKIKQASHDLPSFRIVAL